jgi:hypothetical protein
MEGRHGAMSGGDWRRLETSVLDLKIESSPWVDAECVSKTRAASLRQRGIGGCGLA